MVKKYDVIDMAWVAGFLEGEGSFTRINNNGIKISAGSVDKDVIYKLKNILGCGTIGKTTVTSTGKIFYFYYLTKAEHVNEILHNILPFMGKRRSDKIEDLILTRYIL